MASRRRSVRITANFERNLADIRQFLGEQDAVPAFAALFDELFDTVIPNLEAFPEMGRDFLARIPLSTEGQLRWAIVAEKAGKRWQLREYIRDDYLILYAVADDALLLLAIKHHRQLSFDLKEHWT